MLAERVAKGELPPVEERLPENPFVIEGLDGIGNFGAYHALLDTLGIPHVVIMDGDGQHPPELIPEMVRLHAAGYDIVQTQRLDTAGTSAFKRWTAGGFYAFLNRISDTHVEPGAADFRLLSRAAADGLRQMREHHRFLRGMVSWMGFRTVILPYQPATRMAGTSKYSLRKMVRLALDAAFSFSLAPLWIGMSVGGVFFLLAIAEALEADEERLIAANRLDMDAGRASGLEPALLDAVLELQGCFRLLTICPPNYHFIFFNGHDRKYPFFVFILLSDHKCEFRG